MTPPPATSSSAPRYEIAATGLLFLLATGYFSWGAGASYLSQWNAHRNFVPVSALVLEAQVESRGSTASTHGTSYRPSVTYRYQFQGQTYESNRYFFTGAGWKDFGQAQAAVSRFPMGTEVQAYVDPRQPEQSVLDPSAPPSGLFAFLAPMGILSVGLIVFGLRRRRAN